MTQISFLGTRERWCWWQEVKEWERQTGKVTRDMRYSHECGDLDGNEGQDEQESSWNEVVADVRACLEFILFKWPETSS